MGLVTIPVEHTADHPRTPFDGLSALSLSYSRDA